MPVVKEAMHMGILRSEDSKSPLSGLTWTKLDIQYTVLWEEVYMVKWLGS